MNAVLNVAAARYYAGIGEEVEIRIVAFNAGLNMLRTDRSPVLARLKSMSGRAVGRGDVDRAQRERLDDHQTVGIRP